MKISRSILKNALKRNLNWFRESGIMVPSCGSGGVAERVFVAGDKEITAKVRKAFPAWTEYGSYLVIEPRRPDCNFETALLFGLAGEVFGKNEYKKISSNLLDFLYFRSGLLNRAGDDYLIGAWHWSHVKRGGKAWFDDNSWCIMLPLIAAAKFSDLDKKYQMKTLAETLLPEMCAGFERTFMHYGAEHLGVKHWQDPENKWDGWTDLPHWGALPCMVFCAAHLYTTNPGEKYRDLVQKYFEYVAAVVTKLNASELAYSLIGATVAAKVFSDDKRYMALANQIAGLIYRRMNPENGNIPAEHYESPNGPNLVDTIYTMNWVLIALQNYSALTGSKKDRAAFQKVLKLFVDIQDPSPEPHVSGCWRGMYDLETKSWGGGDHVEGGAGSIYSGWTNAPVASVIAMELLDMSMLDGFNVKQR